MVANIRIYHMETNFTSVVDVETISYRLVKARHHLAHFQRLTDFK